MLPETASGPFVDAETGVSVRHAAKPHARTMLARAATLWFTTTAVGLWIFVFYIVAYHGPLLAQRGLQGMDDTFMPQGYIAGDTLGNITLAIHICLAAFIIGGGTLQLIPQVRRHFPAFHRWNGRTYIPAVVLVSVGGLYLTWSREGGGSLIQEIGISLNAILIVLFAAMATHYARTRRIDVHRRWALRLFMAVSASWFLRIGYTLWFFIADLASIEVETERVFEVLNFGQYLLPLALLEIYFRSQDRNSVRAQVVMAAVLLILSVATGLGVFLATANRWLPHALGSA